MFSFLRVLTRLSSLEEKVQKLEREQREVRLDWEMMYEKTLKLMGRVAKRTVQVENHEAATQEGEPIIPAVSSPLLGRLSSRQLVLHNQIVARRANGGR